jgi:hypothetical protein
MIINATNNTSSTIVINDLSKIAISPGVTINLLERFSLNDVSESDDIITQISNGNITINNGDRDLTISEGLKYVAMHNILIEPRDRSGKLRVHQTSRKLGLRIMWVGEGDDVDDPSSVGGGERLSFEHNPTVSGLDSTEIYKYIDLNCVENETWLHEGYLTWKDAVFDNLTLEMVPRTVDVTVSSNTNYNLYGGYMVVPAAGDGTVELQSDITKHDGGLVYMPDNDLGEPPTAFWNANWSSSNSRYEDITPAPYGNGRYNMFAVEVIFARFINSIPLLGNGFIALNSSDTDQIGHGMRLKMWARTNTDTPPHQWYVGCTVCLHRDRSI